MICIHQRWMQTTEGQQVRAWGLAPSETTLYWDRYEIWYDPAKGESFAEPAVCKWRSASYLEHHLRTIFNEVLKIDGERLSTLKELEQSIHIFIQEAREVIGHVPSKM